MAVGKTRLHTGVISHIGDDLIGIDVDGAVLNAAMDNAGGYKVGDRVEVVLEKILTMRRITLMYIVPSMLMLFLLIVLLFLGVGDNIAGISALGAVALWYAAIWIFGTGLTRWSVVRLRKLD